VTPRQGSIDVDFVRLIRSDTLITSPPRSLSSDMKLMGWLDETLDFVKRALPFYEAVALLRAPLADVAVRRSGSRVATKATVQLATIRCTSPDALPDRAESELRLAPMDTVPQEPDTDSHLEERS
jgi:hypothetical protein